MTHALDHFLCYFTADISIHIYFVYSPSKIHRTLHGFAFVFRTKFDVTSDASEIFQPFLSRYRKKTE